MTERLYSAGLQPPSRTVGEVKIFGELGFGRAADLAGAIRTVGRGASSRTRGLSAVAHLAECHAQAARYLKCSVIDMCPHWRGVCRTLKNCGTSRFGREWTVV